MSYCSACHMIGCKSRLALSFFLCCLGCYCHSLACFSVGRHCGCQCWPTHEARWSPRTELTEMAKSIPCQHSPHHQLWWFFPLPTQYHYDLFSCHWILLWNLKIWYVPSQSLTVQSCACLFKSKPDYIPWNSFCIELCRYVNIGWQSQSR